MLTPAPDEETALYLAVRHGATGCVDVLLAAGASLKLREGHADAGESLTRLAEETLK